MKNTKTVLKELTARYRAVLKKCFLINAGLLVALPVAAQEPDLEYATSKELPAIEVAAEEEYLIKSNFGGYAYDEETGEDSVIGAEGWTSKINSAGTLSLETAKLSGVEEVNVSGGALNLTDSVLKAGNDMTPTSMQIQNASVTLARSDLEAENVIFKDVNLTLQNDSTDDGFGVWGGNNIEIGGNTTITSGNNWSYLAVGNELKVGDGTDDTTLNISSGKLYLDSENNKIQVQEKAALNIANGAEVLAIKSDTIGSETEEFRTITLNKGTIDLSGKLTGNVDSETTGTININSTTATIDGKVGNTESNTIALNINKDYTISNIKDFGNLASLKIADNAKLTYDHSYDHTTQSKRVDSVDLQGDMDVTTRLDVSETLAVNDGSQLDVHGQLNVMEGGINISGGTVNLFGAQDNDETKEEFGTLWARGDINISGGTVNLSGVDATLDTVNDWNGETPTYGNINISGGQVNITDGSANITTQGDITVSNNGELNVAKGAYLHTDADIGDEMLERTIKLSENGTINVAGTLKSHIAGGDTAGTLNIKDSSAKIIGNVNGVNVNFDSAYNVNEGLTILNNLNDVTVNAKDVVWEDADSIQGVNALTITKTGELSLLGNWDGSNDFSSTPDLVVEDDLTNNGSLALSDIVIETFGDVNSSGTLTLNNTVLNNGNTTNKPEATDVLISGGSVTLTGNSQFEADSDKGVMTIADGSVTLKDEGEMGGSVVNINGGTILLDTQKDLLADTVLNIADGTTTVQNGALVSRGDFAMTGGSVVLDNTGSSYNDIRAISGNTFILSGGSIDVYGGSSLRENQGSDTLQTGDNLLVGQTIDITTGGSLNVYGNLFVADEVADDDTFNVGTIKLSDNGALNLTGAIQSNITAGSTAGSLNIADAAAIVDGNVSGVNLNTLSDYKLSGIKGTIGDLGGLTAHKSLTIDKELGTVANLTVKDNATLTLSKNVTATNTALDAGTLDLGTSKLTTDKLTVSDNGTVAFQVSAKDTFGSVAANTYDVSKTGTNLVLTLDTGVLANNETQNFAIFTDKDGVVQKVDFANLSENARYTFVQKEDGTYDITQNAAGGDVIAEAGGDSNAQNTATAWLDQEEMPENSGAKLVQDHLNKLSQLGGDAFVKATEALMPEAAPVVHSMTQALNNQIANIIQTRFGTAPAPQGRSGGDVIEQGAVWAQGLYNKSKLDTATGFDGKTHGLAIGADGFISDDLKVGFGYAYSTSDIDSTGRSTDVDTHSAIAYGEYTIGNAFVNGLATYSRSSYDENKDVAGLSVKADYDMDAIFGQVMTGYNVQTNWATVTPEAGLRYLWTKTHGYTDTADQHVKGDTMNTLTGVAGLRLGTNKKVQDFVLKPAVSLHATYDIIDDESASTVQLANGASYTVQGESLERFGIEAGAQMGISFGNVDVSLDYMGRFKKDYTDHTGMLNLKYNF